MDISEGIPPTRVPHTRVPIEIIKGKSLLKKNEKIETNIDIIIKNDISILCHLNTNSEKNKNSSCISQPYYQILKSYELSGSNTEGIKQGRH